MKFPKTLFILASLGLVVYSNAFANHFVWDDKFLIVQNKYIRSLESLPTLFKTELRVLSGDPSNFYRPLQAVSYLLDYHLWGLFAFGYHLTNFLLHLANALLLYGLGSRFFTKKEMALFVALLFLLHPVQTEAVTYLSGRADPLATFFLLAAFLLWMGGKTFFPLLFFVGSLLSKESALCFPLLLLWAIFCFKNRPAKSTLPFWGIALFYLLLRSGWLNFISVGPPPPEAPFYLRGLTFFRVFSKYLGLLFFPRHLSLERHVPVATSFFEMDVSVTVLALLGFSLMLFLLRKETPSLLFALGWFFLALLPTANIYPIGVQMAEHFLYFPSIGFFLLLGGCLEKGLEKTFLLKSGVFATFCACLILSPLGYRTMVRNLDWKDEITFYEKTLKDAPRNFVILNNLGTAYERMGKLDRALDLFKRAVTLNKRYHKAWNNMGVIHARQGHYVKAISCYRKAIRLKPSVAAYHHHMGEAFVAMGKEEEAIRSFERAAQLDPIYQQPHLALGKLYSRMGWYEEARTELEKALLIDPHFPGVHTDLGEVYFELGFRDLAKEELQEAIRLNPSYERAKEALRRLDTL